MKLIKTLFPLSFGAKNLISMIIKLVIYLLLPSILGFCAWLLSKLPVVGGIFAWIFGILGGIVGIYCIVGIVLLILAFIGLIK